MRKMPKIRISIPFCILVATLYALDFGNVFLPAFVAIMIHEVSHIAAIRLTGASFDRIDIRAFGVSVNVPELIYMPYSKEIIIAAAGPLAGFLTAATALLAANVFGFMVPRYFIGINVLISLINLIPVYPLDGGRIALSLSLKLFSMRAAYVISSVLSILSTGVLFGICAACAAKGNLNPSLVIFSLYVAACQIKLRHL